MEMAFYGKLETKHMSERISSSQALATIRARRKPTHMKKKKEKLRYLCIQNQSLVVYICCGEFVFCKYCIGIIFELCRDIYYFDSFIYFDPDQL